MKTLYIHNEISAFAEATEIKARSVSKKHMFFYFPYIFCCILFLGSSFNVYSQNAQISTDKPSYFPGEQVQIVGTDFQPNEPVQLVIQKIGTPENNDTINTVADQYGDINLTNYTISASDDNTLYTLEASGDISAAAAETTFNGKMGLAQSHNGGIGEPVIDPVIWVNGNANAQNSHYLEGNSIPYRVILNDVAAGTHTIRIKWDIMHGGKHAIDYITSYQRNDAEGISETVDPRSDLPAGVLADPTFFLIPTPASMDVAGKPQPSSSFLSLPAQDRAMACFNGTILSMEYVSEGSFLDDNSTTEIEITYNVPSGPTYVMFAWGGHIAKRTDWGPGSSCASINGSPYHTALGISDFITGAQDRSLKTDAVQFFPTCALDVPDNACPGDIIIATATTDAPSPHFTFSATNGAIISVSGPEDNTAEITVPDGDFVVSVMIVDFFDGQVISEESNCEDSVQVNEVPDASIVTDDDPDCEDNTGAYHVASGDGFTYAWSLSGNASFVGASDGSSVQVLVDDVCNANFELSVVVDNNGCVDSSALEVEFADSIPPVISEGPGDDATIACPAEPEFDAPSASDDCSAATIHQLDDDVDQGDCDGEYVVTRGWYFTDACGNSTDTVYQTITVVDTIAPSINEDAGDDATIACPAEPEFDAPSASDECSQATIHQLEDDVDQGDCDGEYVVTRGWYFTDDCGNVSDTVYQVITVVDTIAPSITEDAGDDEVIACGEDAEFDAPSASDECSAATIHQLEDDIDEGDCASEMTITRGWYFTDDCGNVSDTVYQVISVVDSIAPALSGTGDDYEIDCHEEAVFTAPNVLDNCSEYELIADGPDSLEVDGNIQITMSWYAVDACGNASDTVDQVITVNACNEVFCSLTQGFYGNAKGIACATGERGKDLLARILGPEFGPLVIGSGSRTLTFNSGDVECLIKVMPAGGPSVILPSGNNSFGANCSLPADFLSKPGRLKSVVWGQVITLGLNLRYDVDLGDVQLGGNQFITGEASPGDDGLCGTEDDVFEPGDGLVKQIPQSVLDALDDLYGGDRSIYNLFLLANRVLGGEAIEGVTVLDINAAASAINEGFDECRFLEGFDDTKDLLPAENEELEISSEMNYKVFPNPFNDATTIAFVTNESMNVQVEVFAINGDKVATLYNDYATANTEYRVVLNGAQLQNGVYFVRILSDGGVYETRIILNK